MSSQNKIRKKFFIAGLIVLGLAVWSAVAGPPLAEVALARSEVEQGLDKIKGPFSGINFDTSDPYKLIANLIKLALQIGFMIAVVFVIIGGYFYITSAGNEEQATRGRRTIVYALAGIVIIIMSYVMVNVVVNLFLN